MSAMYTGGWSEWDGGVMGHRLVHLLGKSKVAEFRRSFASAAVDMYLSLVTNAVVEPSRMDLCHVKVLCPSGSGLRVTVAHSALDSCL